MNAAKTVNIIIKSRPLFTVVLEIDAIVKI